MLFDQLEVVEEKLFVSQRQEDLEFINEWNNQLLTQLEMLRRNGADNSSIENAIGECASSCFKRNHFDEKLKGLSNLSEFLEFCQTELGWQVEYDELKGIIICYEGNSECLCPLVRQNRNISHAICCCTQGEIRHMFEYAIQRPVEVEIIHSIIRDGKSCVYKVKLL